MNKRIEELAQKAGATIAAWDGTEMPLVLNKKGQIEEFAKLLILECAKICSTLDENRGCQMSGPMWLDGTYDCADMIKREFGLDKQ